MNQILALLPGGKLYNQLIIHNLIQRGVLKLRESQEMVRHPGAPRLRTYSTRRRRRRTSAALRSPARMLTYPPGTLRCDRLARLA